MSVGKLPTGQELATEDMARHFQRYEFLLPTLGGAVAPCGIVIPNNWCLAANRSAEITPAAEGPVELAIQFDGPQNDPVSPFASVQTAVLSRAIAAADWLRFYCARMDYDIRQLDVVADSIVDALISFSIAKQAFTARLVVRLFGSQVLIVVAGATADGYDDKAGLLGLIVRSVVLHDRRPGGAIETLRTVQLNDGLSCAVPQSWSATAIAGPDRRRGAVDLLNSDHASGDWLGQIRLRWIANDVTMTPADEMKKLEQEIAQAGITLGIQLANQVESRAMGTFTLTGQVVHAAQVGDGTVELECWRSVLHNANFTVFCALLTPARSTQFYWWAVNRRTLEIIAATLR